MSGRGGGVELGLLFEFELGFVVVLEADPEDRLGLVSVFWEGLWNL
ncbi:MAG: hypothetical protein SFT81_02930 [Candidatus Caenarcaniphilales bacterium]|nr:hypothetical protein [Candidatus Caenarcaniphilales bacterium]